MKFLLSLFFLCLSASAEMMQGAGPKGGGSSGGTLSSLTVSGATSLNTLNVTGATTMVGVTLKPAADTAYLGLQNSSSAVNRMRLYVGSGNLGTSDENYIDNVNTILHIRTGLTGNAEALTIDNSQNITLGGSNKIIGGTGTTSTLTLQTTSGVGTTNADMIFKVGNNGATEAMRIKNDASVNITSNSLKIGTSAGSITDANGIFSDGFTIDGAIYINGTNIKSTGTLNVTADTNLVLSANVKLGTAGTAIKNVRHGISGAMTGGAVTVTDTGCTANTRYFLTAHALGTVVLPSAYYVSTRNASTSFVITSNQATDTSTVDWMAVEP